MGCVCMKWVSTSSETQVVSRQSNAVSQWSENPMSWCVTYRCVCLQDWTLHRALSDSTRHNVITTFDLFLFLRDLTRPTFRHVIRIVSLRVLVNCDKHWYVRYETLHATILGTYFYLLTKQQQHFASNIVR